jgi:eukaryotic-like serine/threonine-protein kinase
VANLNSDTGSRSIGPYRLLRRLAQGGLGQVYLGESPDGRLVAIKALHPAVADAPESRSVLAREARAIAQVASPFTVRLIDADTDGPVPWLASEYIAGPTLAERVAGTGPLSVPLLVALAAALAEGLADIHAAGLIHRDLKPSNVILSDN